LEAAWTAALTSLTVSAVEANDLVRKIHDHMPAIIAAGEHQRWFDGADDLLVPYPSDKMSVLPA
jgi:putative SOS response-associated peptidase YedK